MSDTKFNPQLPLPLALSFFPGPSILPIPSVQPPPSALGHRASETVVSSVLSNARSQDSPGWRCQHAESPGPSARWVSLVACRWLESSPGLELCSPLLRGSSEWSV